MFLCISSHLGIQNIGQDLGRKIDHRHLDSSGMQILRCLKADKSGADHDCFLHTVILCICTDSFCVIRSSHLEYARKIFSVDWKLCRGCTDCKH